MDLIPIVGFVRTWWKAALIGLAVAGLCLTLGYCEGKKAGRADILADQRKAALENTHRADEADQAQQQAAQNRADAIEGAMRNAIETDPDAGNRAAGNVSGAVLDELRKRRR